MSSKKRKMEAEPAAPAPAENAREPTPIDDQEDADMMEADADAPSTSPAPVADGPALSSEEVSALLAQLPQTLDLLKKLSAANGTVQTPAFKPLRKEVLRMAAVLQSAHFLGETKDEIQKRQYRRREKSERMARELKQKTEDAKYINSVALRNSRIQALNAMVEPEGWGEKRGDQLLLPGEATKLLMAPMDESATGVPSASPDGSQPSASPPAELSSTIPSAAALAAAAGPQVFTYPTIAPTSELAKLVAAKSASAAGAPGSITKPFVRPIGTNPKQAQAAAAATDAQQQPDSSVLVPALPLSAEEEAARGKIKKNAQSARQQKKALFGQEGVHVNQEQLKAFQKQEEEKKASGEASSVPMETDASAASAGPAAGASVPPVTVPLGVSVDAAAASMVSDPVSGSINGQAEFGPVLNHPRSCYCCKARFYQLHFFYSEFCGPCARLNYAKRNQMADLRGKVVLLTGSRVKIGFRCGLRLLRCGATLIATSRFPHDTAKRYAEEKDFDQWKSRLHIFGLDLRDLKSVVKLAEILSARYDRLDAIINNAAQTVRRPPMYYRHLLPIETMKAEEMPPGWQEVVKGDLHEMAGRQRSLQNQGAAAPAHQLENGAQARPSGVTVEDISHIISDAAPVAAAAAAVASAIGETPAAASTAPSSTSAHSAPIVSDAPPSPNDSSLTGFNRHSDLNAALLTTSNRAAALSQLEVLPGDQHQDSSLFPAGKFDVTGQQLDLRSVNSWNLTLEQVDPSELVEVFAINALSPFILNSRLKGLMLKGSMHPQLGIQTTDKYIINVSAMEGKFYRHKSPNHPHTNAAKAALNMLTRTSAQSYAADRIYMNSVDTGWINDENPYETAKRLFEKTNFQTPIDEEDAMARILDPLLSGVNTGINAYGKFLKDYHETEW